MSIAVISIKVKKLHLNGLIVKFFLKWEDQDNGSHGIIITDNKQTFLYPSSPNPFKLMVLLNRRHCASFFFNIHNILSKLNIGPRYRVA